MSERHAFILKYTSAGFELDVFLGVRFLALKNEFVATECARPLDGRRPLRTASKAFYTARV